ncbi:uncharacterized protein TNCT_257371 [Trichonephila clavata]|uniref:Uncharacterized protein n=1 Tax=Trichonephila clavata TaxID=2740835 RepID=A0A8X6HYU2_TRICU|nr:uncharacterized protein TNCT_257371 [Trichonephila clavata]
MFKIILLFTVGIVVADAIGCITDCKKVQCEPVHCSKDQKLVKNALNCGCCDQCRTIIKKGKHCNPPIFGGLPPTSECEAGTRCTYVERYNTTLCIGG